MLSASISTGAPSSAMKQSTQSSKASHNTDRAAHSKTLDKDGKYGPSQQVRMAGRNQVSPNLICLPL